MLEEQERHEGIDQTQATQALERTGGDDAELTVATPQPGASEDLRAAEADVPVEWDIGDVILDLYEVKHVHEGGGMGLVYRVHHRNWDIDLAVKSPRKNFFRTEGDKENFVHECETWINLGLHPNTASCFYVRTLGGIPRVFAEYIEGGSLKEWINNRKLYEGSQEEILARILDVAIQFAWGLQFAHEKGLVHQDVKPANVLMTPDGTAKVTDFGLAKARARAGEDVPAGSQQSILISSGGMTPAYCSPEQANREPLSRRTDIWSWAVSMLEMFLGEVIWASGVVAGMSFDNYVEMGHEMFKTPMPESLEDLLRWCFQEKPDERPKDMLAIIPALYETYRQAIRQDYGRKEPKAVELLADGLSNQAISLLDLGRQEQAEKLFDEALTVDPHHPEATYNRGLLLWRSGRMTDDVLVRQLEEVRTSHEDDWRTEYYLGLIHIERGDAESAVKVLEKASSMAPEEHDVQRMLLTAQSGTEKWHSCVRIFDTGWGQSASLSPDGRWALSIGWKIDMRLWELATGQCVRIFEGQTLLKFTKGHTSGVNSVSFSQDGRWVLSGSSE